MAQMLVRYKVKDYAKWKSVFDEYGTTRKKSGSKGGRLFRNADNPNEMVFLLEWDSLEKAKNFAQSQDLKNTRQRAGVIDKPDVYFLEEVERVKE